MPPAIVIDHHLCTRCIKCVRSCPADILIREQSKDKTHKFIIEVTDAALCFECRACEVVCPEDAVQVLCSVQAIPSPVV